MGDIQTRLREQVAEAKRAGLHQYRIAYQMDMSEGLFSKILNGAVPLPADFAERLPIAIEAARKEQSRRLLEGIDGEAVA